MRVMVSNPRRQRQIPVRKSLIFCAEGLDLSKQCGADVVVDARLGKEAVVKEVMFARGEGCDSAINVSDATEAASLACAVTKMHGRMIQIAQPDNISIPFQEIIFRNMKVNFSHKSIVILTKED